MSILILIPVLLCQSEAGKTILSEGGDPLGRRFFVFGLEVDMNSSPDRPFVASDPAVAASVERWLDRQGYAIAYGPQSARADRGDLFLSVPGLERPSAPAGEMLEAA